jgi:hypothetical protein
MVPALLACSAVPLRHPPSRRLGNPVLDARAALAAGDSTFLAVARDTLLLPGLEGTGIRAADEDGFRMFSRRSLALDAESYAALADSLTTYAAAYNRLVYEARLGRERPGS